jgi:membrane-bound ClpP family serine protease
VSGRGPIAAGLVLIVIGLLFFAREAIPGFDFGQLWPIASVILGVALLVLSIRPGRPNA